jgi:hypothetical protein
VAGLGAAQFALAAALDRLRSLRDAPESPNTVVLAATDPANPYGAIVPWPVSHHGDSAATGRGPTRSAGALVILVDGYSAGYLRRGERELLVFAPDTEPLRSRLLRETARALMRLAAFREEGRRGMLIAEINGAPASSYPAIRLFIEEGFAATAMGLQARTERLRPSGFDVSGTRIAGENRGGVAMEHPERQPGGRAQEQPDSAHDAERDRRGTRDADDSTPRQSGDVDPDSASAEIDRDDTVEE